jgi:hypothetical protein
MRILLFSESQPVLRGNSSPNKRQEPAYLVQRLRVSRKTFRVCCELITVGLNRLPSSLSWQRHFTGSGGLPMLHPRAIDARGRNLPG